MTTPDHTAPRTHRAHPVLTHLLILGAILAVVLGIPAIAAAGPGPAVLVSLALIAIYILTGRWTR